MWTHTQTPHTHTHRHTQTHTQHIRTRRHTHTRTQNTYAHTRTYTQNTHTHTHTHRKYRKYASVGGPQIEVSGVSGAPTKQGLRGETNDQCVTLLSSLIMVATVTAPKAKRGAVKNEQHHTTVNFHCCRGDRERRRREQEREREGEGEGA